MSILSWVLVAFLLLTCAIWSLGPFIILMMSRTIRRLADLPIEEHATWPRLSIVIPACNEADTLLPATKTLLDQDYDNMELILINDRSTDGTGEIIDRLAADDRIQPIHIDTLPDSWLGKVHALDHGVKKVSGEWILFTDADVHFAQGALRRAIGWAEKEKLDHLCIIPELESHNLLVDLCIAATLRAIVVSQKPWKAQDPESEQALGSGGFNLVRKSKFDETKGFEWLRLEVADDVGLGHMMKHCGGRAGVLVGKGQVQVPWYTTFWGLVRGLEKNGFAQIARYNLLRGLFVSVMMVLIGIGPALTFLPHWGVPWLWLGGAVAFTAMITGAFLLYRWAGVPWLSSILSAPLGDLLLSLIVARASIVGFLRGGLMWRGKLYPSSTLRRGQRLNF